MREIKFRVRDQDGCIIGYERLTPRGGWQRRFDHEKSEWSPDVTTGASYNIFWPQGGETLIREQYIGHKDKNNKEIYEGDIVRVTQILGKHTIYVVLWEDHYPGFACFYPRDRIEKDNPVRIVDELRYEEVIGTIYEENPELLEEQG